MPPLVYGAVDAPDGAVKGGLPQDLDGRVTKSQQVGGGLLCGVRAGQGVLWERYGFNDAILARARGESATVAKGPQRGGAACLEGGDNAQRPPVGRHGDSLLS